MSDAKKCDVKSCNNYMDDNYFEIKVFEAKVRGVVKEEGWLEDKEICLECLKELFEIEWEE